MLYDLVDGALHIERLLFLRIMLSFKDLLHRANGLFKCNVFTGCASERFADEERLREELLDLACPVYKSLIFIRKLLDTKDGDDILEILIALKNLFGLGCDAIVFLSYDERIECLRRRFKWVDGRIDTESCKWE